MVNLKARLLRGSTPCDAESTGRQQQYSDRASEEKGEKKLHRGTGTLSVSGAAAADTAQNLRDGSSSSSSRQEPCDQAGTSNPSGLRGCQSKVHDHSADGPKEHWHNIPHCAGTFLGCLCSRCHIENQLCVKTNKH